MGKKSILVLSSVVVIGLLVYLFGYRWQPGPTVLRHQQDILDAACNENWDDFRSHLSDDFSNSWDLPVENFIEVAGQAQVVAQPKLHMIEPTVQVRNGKAVVVSRLRLTGFDRTGAKDGFNSIRDPFVFRWRNVGGRNWKLFRVENSSFELSKSGGFSL